MKSGTSKWLCIFALLAVITLATIQNAAALGITPGRLVLYAEPDLELTAHLKVLNNEHKAFKLTVFARGDLSSFVDIKQRTLEFTPADEYKEVDVLIKLPRKLGKPGTNELEIVAREVSPQEGAGEIAVGYLLSVVSQIYVMVPYEGRYIKASLDIVETEPGKAVKFFIPVINLGSDDLKSIKATLDIYSRDNKVATVFTNERAAKSNERVELAGVWNKDLVAGMYHVKATIDFDGETETLEQDFFVGGFLVELLDVSVSNFKLGDIAKFNILVRNKGNVEVKDAYSRIILNENTNRIADIQSTPVNVAPLETTEMNAFWDTSNVKVGVYEGELSLNYEDKSSSKPIKTTVTQDSIKVEITGVTAHAVAAGEEKGKFSVLWAIIIILVIANIAWFLYFKKKGKKK